MKKAEISGENFVCLPTYPLSDKEKSFMLANGMDKRCIYHNCSGKHLGLMLLSKYLKEDIGMYWESDSKVQRLILEYISYISTCPVESIKLGVDGCGVPVFAMELRYLATAYLRLACPDLIEDTSIRRAVTRITKEMNDNSRMVSGKGMICSLLLEDDNIVAKGGARGVYCFALKKEGLGFAIKIMDGSDIPWAITIASILEQIDYSNKETIDRIYKHFPKEILNDNDRLIGHRKSVFRL